MSSASVSVSDHQDCKDGLWETSHVLWDPLLRDRQNECLCLHSPASYQEGRTRVLGQGGELLALPSLFGKSQRTVRKGSQSGEAKSKEERESTVGKAPGVPPSRCLCVQLLRESACSPGGQGQGLENIRRPHQASCGGWRSPGPRRPDSILTPWGKRGTGG